MAMNFPYNPAIGQTYSVTNGPTYTWDGAAWIVQTPGSNFSRQKFTATAGQTIFPISGGYQIGGVDVFLNGVKLVSGDDFVATDKTNVVLTSGAAVGDSLEVIALALLDYPGAVKITDENGAAKIPSGTTAQRPANPGNGFTRHNTTIGSLEFWDAGAGAWIATNLIPVVNSVTGSIYAGAASTLSLSLSNATDKIDVVFTKAGTVLATVTNVAVATGVASGVSVPSGVYSAVSVGDTVSISTKNQDGTPSSNGQSKTVAALPTGGTITSAGGYRYHTFGSSGSLVVPSGFSVTADFLIVGGGGSGGQSNNGAGGGAGGLIQESATISAGTLTVVIGAGGSVATAGASSASAATGSNSSVTGRSIAIGGGYGGSNSDPRTGGNGGSGGGGTYLYGGGSGTAGQGNAGGQGYGTASAPYSGGGGGGAGAAGESAYSKSSGGDGGAGINWKSLGNYYAGGGGGGTHYAAGGAGGVGGGGAGGNGSVANYASTCGVSGSTNTGGGGGAGSLNFAVGTAGAGGLGGSGIVIIRYAL